MNLEYRRLNISSETCFMSLSFIRTYCSMKNIFIKELHKYNVQVQVLDFSVMHKRIEDIENARMLFCSPSINYVSRKIWTIVKHST